jgi:hypothetical protein
MKSIITSFNNLKQKDHNIKSYLSFKENTYNKYLLYY